VQPAAAEHHLIQQLYVVYNSVNLKNLQEAYHDAFQLKDESLTLFTLGLITLEERAKAEELYWCGTGRERARGNLVYVSGVFYECIQNITHILSLSLSR
jgi:arginine decarboxylase-like protein